MTTTTVTQLKPYENTLHDRVFCGVCILLCAIMWISFIHGVYFAIICGNSMVPTLNNGSICVAIQLDAESTMPERGDIVAFYLHPDHDINCVKRVVGLPGDTVLSNNDRLYINGTYIDCIPGTGTWRIDVPERYLFCLGDNRALSADSRTFGCIPMEQIHSKILFVGA